MKNEKRLIAYILIGIGIYFLIRQLDLALFTNFYNWPTFLMIVGICFLIYSYTENIHDHLFFGVILFGLGIHFHGLENYSFWFHHWSVYPLIVGIAYLITFIKNKTGLFQAIILLTIALLMIFSVTLPTWFEWIYWVVEFLETFWPVALIVIGIYMLLQKK